MEGIEPSSLPHGRKRNTTIRHWLSSGREEYFFPLRKSHSTSIGISGQLVYRVLLDLLKEVDSIPYLNLTPTKHITPSKKEIKICSNTLKAKTNLG